MKTVVVLPARLDSGSHLQVANLFDCFLDDEGILDGSNVSILGARTFEIFFTLSNYLEEKGSDLQLLGPSENLLRDLRTLGHDELQPSGAQFA